MEKHITNPWKWQDNLGYAQAVEVKNNKGTLYCAGQAAINAEGQPVDVNMSEQIKLSLSNLEQVIKQSGYHPQNIVRINYYTTSINDFFAAYGDVMGWIGEHHVAASSTLIEVKALAFPQLLVEIEATVVE